MKFFILFAAFVGLTSGLPTIKEELLQKLTRSEQRLQEALVYTHAHQLTYHQSVYETWLKQVHESRRSVEQLSNNIKAGQITEKVEIITEQEKLIIARIADPNPAETAKTSAIYLAAMKALSSYEADHSTAQKYLDDVLAIVRQEDWVEQNPNGIRLKPNSIDIAKANLDRMYVALKSTTAGWTIPGFNDYYSLANKTRVLLDSYRDHEMPVETAKMEEHLKKYDELTLEMARSWPIKEDNLNHYFNLSKAHREHEMAMETPKQPHYSDKDRFLDSLKYDEKKLTAGIQDFKRRFLTYYAQRGELLIPYLHRIVEEVKGMSHNMNTVRYLNTKRGIESLNSEVHWALVRPAEEETLKVGALYVAALKRNHLDDDSSNVTFADIKSKVSEIMHAELSFIKPNMDFRQTVNAIHINQVLDEKRRELKKMVEATGKKLREVNDDQELEDKVREKIGDLKEMNLTKEASKGEYELNFFITKTYNMNSLLPIDNDQKLEQYYGAVASHYDSVLKLKHFLEEKH